MREDSNADFWAWCLKAYADPLVARAALRLQDRAGACVMLVLCICWRASRGLVDGEPELATLLAAVTPLERHTLRPLRAARRALRHAGFRFPGSSVTSAGEAVLQAELLIERLHARSLAASPEGNRGPREEAGDYAARVLDLYLQRLAATGNRDRALARVLARRLCSDRRISRPPSARV